MYVYIYIYIYIVMALPNDENRKQLALSDIHNSAWYDAMHDRTNYKSTVSTVNEDLFMTEPRYFPSDVANPDNAYTFLDLFVYKHTLEPKKTTINPIPTDSEPGYGEMRIVDVYNGVFHGFGLNEFIDPADTSTANYLKHFYNTNSTQPPTMFDGLDPTRFPNSYLYNCDKLLFSYFKTLEEEGAAMAVEAEEEAAAAAAEDDWNNWSTTNCEIRHLNNLNNFWQTLLDKISDEYNNTFQSPPVDQEVFDGDAHNDAIEILKKIVFIGFEKYKLGASIEDYRKYLYTYPKWNFIGTPMDEDYFFTITRGLCIEHILSNQYPDGDVRTIPREDAPVNVSLPPKHPNNPTDEQRSCYKGLEALLDTSLGETTNPDPEKQHFFMLLKYAGDTSHLHLYDLLERACVNKGIESPNLSIYLSERPLLLRAFAENKNIYCKYLARFGDKSIIKSPSEVLKLTNENPNVIALKRAKKYIEDIDKVRTLLDEYNAYEPTLDENDEVRTIILEPDLTLSITANDIEWPPVGEAMNEDIDKINANHGIIQQIIACSELVEKTSVFIKDIKYVNHNIINAALFKKSRRPYLPSIRQYITSMLSNALQAKKQEYLNRALEYLFVFTSILIPKTSDSRLSDPASKLLSKMIIHKLGAELVKDKNAFKELALVNISVGEGAAANAVTFRMQTNVDTVRIWIEDGYEQSSGAPLNKPKNTGIKNIAEYLIAYDLLTHQMFNGTTLIAGGGMVGGAAMAMEPEMPVGPLLEAAEYMDIFDLDEEIVKGELSYKIGNLIQKVQVDGDTDEEDGDMDDVDDIIERFITDIIMFDERIEEYNKKDDEKNLLDEQHWYNLQIDGLITKYNDEHRIDVSKVFEPALLYLVMEKDHARTRAGEGAAEADDVNSIDIGIPDIVIAYYNNIIEDRQREPLMTETVMANALKTARILANNGQRSGRVVGGPVRTGRRTARRRWPWVRPKPHRNGDNRTPSPKREPSVMSHFKPIPIKPIPMEFSGGANKTRKKTKSSQLRKTIKKRRVKKIKRKSLRRRKPIKKRVNSKNRKVKRKIKNKTKKYKKPKKQKRSRKPKPKP